MRARALPVVLTAAAVLAAGCANVPRSSSPDVIGPIAGVNNGSGPPSAPQAGADPRTLVSNFLDNNASTDPNHAAARLYLTPDARSRWSDTTATILADPQVGTYDDINHTVAVTGPELGTLDASGIYRPVVTPSPPAKFVFTIATVGSGTAPGPGRASTPTYRISGLDTGLVLSEDQFEKFYRQRSIYFFDLGETHLIPDPRYSAFADNDQADLAPWLLAGLVGGPRPELQTAAASELPAQLDPRAVSLTLGDVVNVTLPGASQLDGTTRFKLAAEVAVTLGEATGSEPIQILDAGKPIAIPRISGTQFSGADFVTTYNPNPPDPPDLYYVNGGGVRTETGEPVAGALGSGGYGLTSVGLAKAGPDDLYVAGVTGSGDAQRLLVGTRSQGLHPTGVIGPLTRPAYVPGTDEVWVGSGETLVRYVGGRATTVPITLTTGLLPGRILAVRLSPEGSRVAMVLAGANNTAQLWIGSVVRPPGGQVRVDSLEPISPPGVRVSDVAWNGKLKLFVIGQNTSSGQYNVFEVQVDGSVWAARALTNLPGSPTSITVAEGVAAWVSAAQTVWTQRGNIWVSEGGGLKEIFGINPVYVE